MSLAVLLKYDPAQRQGMSRSLWLPVLWLFVAGSRLPSQWLNGPVGMSTQAMEEGNPLDRTILFLMIALAIWILAQRSFRWGPFWARNPALMAFLAFALVSVCWSDFPFVTFKRWFRDLGNYFIMLIPLTDLRPIEAIRTVFRRFSYLIIPLSVVLIKYFPNLSNQYDIWTGARTIGGATTNKNMLGVACLISGLFFFWDTVSRWNERKERRTRKILAVNVLFFVMTLWVLHMASSTTSSVCLVLGCLVIASAHVKLFRRHPGLLHALIPASFCLYLILDFVLGMNGSMAQAVGKDPTLTDRTKIWAYLLSMHTNPIIGTGYQSFWLGSRLNDFWQNSGLGHINEAHNGYLQVYLDLGLIGDLLLIAFLVTSYRAICRKTGPLSSFAPFGLAIWMVVVFYNMSEAAFQSGLMYTVFLMVAMSVQQRVKRRTEAAPELNDKVVAV